MSQVVPIPNERREELMRDLNRDPHEMTDTQGFVPLAANFSPDLLAESKPEPYKPPRSERRKHGQRNPRKHKRVKLR